MSIIFNYDRETKVYIDSSEADENPMRPGEYMLPAFSTLEMPPHEDGKAPVFDEKTQTWSLVVDHRGETWYEADGEPVEIEVAGDPSTFTPPLSSVPPPPPAPQTPAYAALSDWRVGLTLWGRIDEVTARVKALIASTDPKQVLYGKIANERLEYANGVLLSELTQLRDTFGFTEDEVAESMWRADRVAFGDLSGVWPLPETTASTSQDGQDTTPSA